MSKIISAAHSDAACVLRTKKTTVNSYTPRQSAIAAESSAIASVVWTTVLTALDHKICNLLKIQEVHL
jgi:hypothetical protein